MEWLNILAGLAVLFFGRRLFWLFVGCVGFIVGFELADNALQGQSEWVILSSRWAWVCSVPLRPFFSSASSSSSPDFSPADIACPPLRPRCSRCRVKPILWIAFAVGGLLGAILTVVLLDPALIIMSSLAGATAVSQNVPLDPPARTVLFVVLLVVGIGVQVGEYARRNQTATAARGFGIEPIQ